MTSHIGTASGAALAAAILIATPTMANEDTTVHLTAYVPIHCNVALTPTAVHSGTGLIPLGQSIEVCNSPRGYRIILQHPEGLTNVALISDSQRIPLSASGNTVLVDSNHPSLEVRQLALDVGDQQNQISHLGIRIEVNF